VLIALGVIVASTPPPHYQPEKIYCIKSTALGRTTWEHVTGKELTLLRPHEGTIKKLLGIVFLAAGIVVIWKSCKDYGKEIERKKRRKALRHTAKS
jgi:hypothetical protein